MISKNKPFINLLGKINYLLGILSLLTLPLDIMLNSITILFWGVSSILLFVIKGDAYFKILPYFIPFFLLFFIMVTRDAFDNSLYDLIKRSEKKAALILIPIISCFSVPIDPNKTLKAFSVIMTVISLSCLIMGSINALSLSETAEIKINYWYYSYGVFSSPSGIPTNYFSLFVATCLIYLLGWKKRIKKLELFMIVILLLTMILLMTRMVTILTFIFLLVYFFFGTKWHWTKKVFITFGIIVSLLVAFNFHPVFKRRYNALYESKKSSFSGLNMKLTMWDAIYHELIKENIIFGIGEKDAKEKVIPLYKESNLTTAAKYGYNSHNQYIDIQLQYGVVGLITLSALLITLFWASIKMKETFFTIFILLISCMFLTESVLFRQKGIVLFTFISCLFIKEHVIMKAYKYKISV